MDSVAQQTLPTSVQLDLDGQSREFRDSSGSMYFIFVMSLIFIYLVLAAQFESWRNPLIIMLSVPLSMTGALLALWLSGDTIDIQPDWFDHVGGADHQTRYSDCRVCYPTALSRVGLYSAVVKASEMRLRPILMTTGAMVLGVLPLAYATGAGAESRHQIGWVLVGGLTFGTVLTLFVVPVAYTFIAARARLRE